MHIVFKITIKSMNNNTSLINMLIAELQFKFEIIKNRIFHVQSLINARKSAQFSLNEYWCTLHDDYVENLWSFHELISDEILSWFGEVWFVRLKFSLKTLLNISKSNGKKNKFCLSSTSIEVRFVFFTSNAFIFC